MLTQKSSRPTRQRLLDAAETLMRTTGLAGATTKAIAREADCSEAALYKHFANKEELFVQVLMERAPGAGPLVAELTAGPDDPRGVEERLTAVARHAADFYVEGMPLTSSLFADPELLRRHRDGILRIGAGPHKLLDALAGYLTAERTRGRVRADAEPYAAASLLLGACFQRAFLLHFLGAGHVAPAEEFAASTGRTTWAALR